ncbi:hypothetical protein HPB48_017520 [Haemaphysalis longicornis]|uniref:Uncharacterized protein n=1 Tax=Haemaphysalis longicornis TaxID=44386 RepID=A0A9J6GSF6_HAELO|nr:hypothetical protein HPB48_017520 [Haemaphysalis longicornis]
MDNKLAHLLEAKNTLRKRGETQKLNRRLRKKIALLNKQKKKLPGNLTSKGNEKCTQLDGRMRAGGGGGGGISSNFSSTVRKPEQSTDSIDRIYINSAGKV